jgi:hypothetical protein
VPENPFADTDNTSYGNVTEDQAKTARTQIEDAAKGTLPDAAKIPAPQALDSGVYTADQMKPWQKGGIGGTVLKNEAGYTAKQIAEGITTDDPAFANYTVRDAIRLLQEEQKLIGQPDPNSKMSMQGTDSFINKEDENVAAAGAADGASYTASQADAPEDAKRQEAEEIAEAETTIARDKVGTTGIAVGNTREAIITEINKLTQEAEAAGMPSDQALEKAKADFVAGSLSAGATITDGPQGVGGQINTTPQAEAQSRQAITGTAPEGDAAQIGGIPTLNAASRQAVTGAARTGAASEMLTQVGDLPPEVSAAIIEDAPTVTAQVDSQSIDVQAAIASLPVEALVSSQMETLLAGMEDGTTPTWARAAVAGVQEQMAQRGLDVSTVGRDALFNAIIQTTLPLAQSNAQALQQRASQNLSNEQQANLQQSQQDMQRRMANIANSQTAASQTAQMAQQVSLQQGQLSQQAGMTSAQLQQQTRLQNLQNQQRSAELNTQQQQQANLANLSNEQQMAALNLQVEADRLKDEFGADQQVELLKFQTAADFMAKNTAFTQQMNLANLSSEEKLELANLSAKNQAASETMSAAQQTELANLEAKMRVGITNANLANAMGIAQLSTDQALAMQNAQIVAGMDMANFSTEQQMVLANSKFMQSITAQDFSQEHQAAMQNATAMANLDMATVDQRTKLSITNANNFLQMNMANLSNEQQSFVLDAQMRQQALLSDTAAANAASQFNAASQNQLDQYMMGLSQQIELTNKQRNDAMEQFNVTQDNAAKAQEAGNQQQANILNAQLKTDVAKFNDAQDYNREQFNAQQATAIEQFNVNWRREANRMDTAATNAVNQQNAQNAFNMSSQAMSFMWQELRDQMDYSFKTYDNDQQRKASLIVAALGNEAAIGEDGGWSNTYSNMGTLFSNFLGGPTG